MKRAVALLGFVMSAVLAGLPRAGADECYKTDSQVYSCTDPAFPQCGYNPARNEWLCLARDEVMCSSTAASWYCPAGQYCNGDGSTEPKCRQ